eukprot:Awhi_evm2s8825
MSSILVSQQQHQASAPVLTSNLILPLFTTNVNQRFSNQKIKQETKKTSASLQQAAGDYNNSYLTANYHGFNFTKTSSMSDSYSIDFHRETLQKLDLTDKVILEVGCAGGDELRNLQNRGAKALIGVDQNPMFIDIARRTSKSNDDDDDDDSVDVIISRFTLHYTENAYDLAKELRRVLKPNGLLYCVLNVVDMKPIGTHSPLYLQEPVASDRWYPLFINFGERQFTAKNCATSTQDWLDALEAAEFEVTLLAKLCSSEKWNNEKVQYTHHELADLFTLTVHATSTKKH